METNTTKTDDTANNKHRAFIIAPRVQALQFVAEKGKKARPCLTGVLFDTKNKLAVACNGGAMALRTIRDFEHLPQQTIYQFTSPLQKKTREEREILVPANGPDGGNRCYISPETGLRANLIDADYPDYAQVIEKMKREQKASKSLVSITLDAELLLNLAKAIDAPGQKVTLTFSEASLCSDNGPVEVTCNDSDCYGIIMPCQKLKK